MAIRTVEYVDQPFAMKRFTPDTSRLGALMTQGAGRIAEIDLQKGANATRLFDTLGNIWTGYQQQQAQAKALKATLAVREKEHADDLSEKEKERAERKAERDDAARIRKEDQEHAEVRDWADNRVAAGVVPDTPQNRVMLQIASKYPDVAARFNKQQALPARPVDPSMGSMAAPEPMVTREATGPEMRQAGADQRNIEAATLMEENRVRDDARADSNLARSLAAQASSEEHQRTMERIAQQNANTTQRRYTSTGLDASNLDPAFTDALDSAIMSFPQTKRRPVVDQANRAAAAGDAERVKEIIKQAAMEGENVDTRNQVRSRMATIAALDDAKVMIDALKAKGVNPNFFTGTAEDLVRKIGETTDPGLVELKTRLMDTVIQYRRAATGVAFGEREGRDYERMFPNYSQSMPVNDAAINGLKRAMEGNNRSYWEGKLGKKGAALVTSSQAAPDAGSTQKPSFVFNPATGKIEPVKP